MREKKKQQHEKNFSRIKEIRNQEENEDEEKDEKEEGKGVNIKNELRVNGEK